MDEAIEVPQEFIKERMHNPSSCPVCGPFVNSPAYKRGKQLAVEHAGRK